MNTQEVVQLIQVLKETGFKHVDVSHNGSHILMSNSDFINRDVSQNITSQPAPQQTVQAPSVETLSQSNTMVETKIETSEAVSKSGHIVESPIVGTFYTAPTPDTEPYVAVGSKVKKGDVLCIVEAMKLMNEIEADADGEIAEILVENEAGVEYGQPLFRIV